MWAVPLEYEVIVSIDPSMKDGTIQKLRPVPSFALARDIIEAYPILIDKNSHGDELPIPTSTKISISNVIYHFAPVQLLKSESFNPMSIRSSKQSQRNKNHILRCRSLNHNCPIVNLPHRSSNNPHLFIVCQEYNDGLLPI
eukprot:TRINITY_DN1299_c0_g1_i17.p1 TRINITY_DN1299_c0_g1~~TRINITY_DN1299_c0_g1_i17.p1  ORF type:complete len:141 (+),score=4.25 TRINITY_DN1299_c0_g1_i17:1268-1690(+)